MSDTDTATQAVEEVLVAEVTPLPAITSIAEWKKKAQARWLITLPSGNVVKVRKPKWEKVFNNAGVDAEQLLNFSADTPAAIIKGVMPLAKALAPYVVEEPPIGPDGLSIEDFDEFDLLALFTWARGTNTALPVVEV